MKTHTLLLAALLVALLSCLVACSGGDANSDADASASDNDRADQGSSAPEAPGDGDAGDGDAGATTEGPYALAALPEDATVMSVHEARSAELTDQVVVVEGRVRVANSGLYAVTLADNTTINFCGQATEETCGTPWDYCCEAPDDVAANALSVRFVLGGATSPAEITDAPTYRLLDLIRVVGTMVEDANGNRVFYATGYVALDRPVLEHAVNWPAS